MNQRTLSLIAGISYLIIFVTAIYANFFVLDALLSNPVTMVEQHGMSVRLGILAFLIAAVFDVIVAWVLYELYENHPLTRISTYFRIMHATIMGIAVFALVPTLTLSTSESILAQVTAFNTMWLIGLFFFGVHLILLGRIIKNIKIIPLFLVLAGIMYIVDTSAHFLMPNYAAYAGIFLMMVAVPSIVGEMALAIWLLIKGGKGNTQNVL